MWYVYILKMADGEYYVGSTNDLKCYLPASALSVSPA
ncbi:MAG: GIY-YIG nuclease family protein [Planctomycetota bacterium]